MYGGKLGESESFEDALVREFKEETGLDVINFTKIAILEYIKTNNYISEHQIFLVTDYRGVLCETEEMEPFWFRFSEVPYEKMWEDSVIGCLIF